MFMSMGMCLAWVVPASAQLARIEVCATDLANKSTGCHVLDEVNFDWPDAATGSWGAASAVEMRAMSNRHTFVADCNVGPEHRCRIRVECESAPSDSNPYEVSSSDGYMTWMGGVLEYEGYPGSPRHVFVYTPTLAVSICRAEVTVLPAVMSLVTTQGVYYPRVAD